LTKNLLQVELLKNSITQTINSVTGKKRKLIAEKLLRLRCRIEDWTRIHGWNKQSNHEERKDKDDLVVWKRSDWEYVDDVYGSLINDHEVWLDYEAYTNFNRMWKQYNVKPGWKGPFNQIEIDNPNFDPDWEQLQQMEWHDD